MGGGYYGQGHGIYRNQPYMNQNYHGAWHKPTQPRLPFLTMLKLPDLSKLMNDPVSHDLAWPAVPTKLPSDIPKFEENQEKILVNMSLLLTFGSLPSPYTMTQSI